MLTIIIAAAFAAAAYWAASRTGRRLTQFSEQGRTRAFTAGWLAMVAVLAIVFALGWAFESRELVIGVVVGSLAAPLIDKALQLRSRQRN